MPGTCVDDIAIGSPSLTDEPSGRADGGYAAGDLRIAIAAGRPAPWRAVVYVRMTVSSSTVRKATDSGEPFFPLTLGPGPPQTGEHGESIEPAIIVRVSLIVISLEFSDCLLQSGRATRSLPARSGRATRPGSGRADCPYSRGCQQAVLVAGLRESERASATSTFFFW